MTGITNTINPIDQEGTHNLDLGPLWAAITFGTLFILIGLSLFGWYPKAKRNAENYKQRQIEEWKKQKGRSGNVSYKQTGMFLPAWEKTKLFAPVLIGSVFIIMGIAWLVGKTLFSL